MNESWVSNTDYTYSYDEISRKVRHKYIKFMNTLI